MNMGDKVSSFLAASRDGQTSPRSHAHAVRLEYKARASGESLIDIPGSKAMIEWKFILGSKSLKRKLK